MNLLLWTDFIVLITIIAQVGNLFAKDHECLASIKHMQLNTEIREFFNEGVVEIDGESSASIQNLSIKIIMPKTINQEVSSLTPLLQQSDLFDAIDICNVCNSNKREPNSDESDDFDEYEYSRPTSSTAYWGLLSGSLPFEYRNTYNRYNGYFDWSSPIKDWKNFCKNHNLCYEKVSLGVETLNISSCKLKQLASTMFPSNFRVTCIKTLDVSDNNLLSIDSNEFINFTSLKHLYAHHNNLTEINFQYVNLLSGRLPKELLVHLSYDKLKYGLRNLQAFDLSYNRLTRMTITDLSKLNCLNVSNNLLNIDANFIQNLPQSLTNLTLSYNRLINLETNFFERLSALTHLELRGFNISEIPTGTFNGLVSLSVLDLSDNELANLPYDFLSDLTNIVQLHLFNNMFYTVDFSMFPSITLSLLDLSYNSISYIDSQELNEHLPNLQTLNIDGNDFYCQDLREMISSLTTFNVNVPTGESYISSRSSIHEMACRQTECLADIRDERIRAELKNYFDSELVAIEVISEEQPLAIQNLSIKLVLPTMSQLNGSIIVTQLIQSEVLGEVDFYEECYSSVYGVWRNGWLLRNHVRGSNGYRECRHSAEEISLGVEYLDISSFHLAEIRLLTGLDNFQFTCLETLDISDNDIWSINMNDFTHFKHLKTLDAQSNKIEKIDFQVTQSQLSDDSIQNTDKNPSGLQTLEKLILSYNVIGYLNIAGLSKLEFLDISHNNVKIDEDFIETLPNSLSTLIVSYNQPLRLKPNYFTRLSELTKLELSGLNIREVPFNTFKGLESLQSLYLSFNNLSSLPLGILLDLKHLEYLSLSDNQFHTIDFSVFYAEDVTALGSLNLANNLMTTVDLRWIFKLNVFLPHLKSIDISGNRWNCLDLKEIIFHWVKMNITILPSDNVIENNISPNVGGIECDLPCTSNCKTFGDL